MAELLSKLDNIYKKKAEAAFIRSRKRWLEEDEKNTSNFFRLKKNQATWNAIHQIYKDLKEILEFCPPFTLNHMCHNMMLKPQMFYFLNSLGEIIIIKMSLPELAV